MQNINLQKNNGPAPYEAKGFRSGFVILFAVTISSIMLAIALGVSYIAFKEIKFGTSAKDTNEAFFAADTGVEWVLFNDKTGSTTFPLVPNQDTIYPDRFISGLSSNAAGCAIVRVEKNDTVSPMLTSIIVKGYNTGGNIANQCNPPTNSIERELDVNY